MTEQYIGKQDIRRLRQNSKRRIERELENGIGSTKKPENYITTETDLKSPTKEKPITSELKAKEENVTKERRKREPWPLCAICAESTSASPGKTPQWWDNQWQCENCTFGIYEAVIVKGKYE